MKGTGSARNPPAVIPPLDPAMQDRGSSPTLTAKKQRCSRPSMPPWQLTTQRLPSPARGPDRSNLSLRHQIVDFDGGRRGEERREEERREEDPLSTWFFAGRLQQEAAQEAPSCTVDARIVACVVSIDMRVGA